MRNIFHRHRGDQRGDTIVEVMIVLAVLGTAISISYATANKSLMATRAAQENSQATALLQSQVELLRSMAPTSTADKPADQNIFDLSRPNRFCVILTTHTPPAPATLAVATATPGVAGDPCKNGIYDIVIAYYQNGFPDALPDGGTPDTSKDTFILKATWDNVAGEGKDSSTMTYRVHQK
ncbi:MAG: hypothetical protein JWO35_395 [Candidatus Saccharibacteria bacterium]|nr:hypothetical protein [Candidatus Saccharibacteria bacterium]